MAGEGVRFEYEVYYLAYTLFASIPEQLATYSAEYLFNHLRKQARSLTPEHDLYKPLARLFPDQISN